MRRALRILFWGLLGLMVILAGTAAWLVGTTSGARTAADLAQRVEPRLTLEVTGGSLWRGLELADSGWRDGDLVVTAGRVVTRWDPACLTDRAFCLSRAQVHDLDARIPEAAPEEPGPEPPPAEALMGRLDLPIDLRLAGVELRGARLRVAGQDIALDFLGLEGALEGDVLTLVRTELRGLQIRLPEAEPAVDGDAEPDTAAGTALADFQYTPPVLPEVHLPLDVHLHVFRLREGALWLPGADEALPLPDVDLTASLEGQQLGLARLDLSNPYGDLRSQGRLELAGDWPLALQLSLSGGEGLAPLLPLALPDTPQLDLELAGTLQTGLTFALAAATGDQSLTLDGEVAPLDARLPVELQARWSHLGWPLDDPEGYRARDGELRLSGDLAGWRAHLRSDLTGPDLPAAGLDLQAHGDLTWARVEALTLELLEGSAELAGVVDWSGPPQWDLGLTLRGLNPGGFWDGAPERVDGRLESAGRLTPEGPELRLSIPGVNARVQDYALALDGAVDLDAAGHLRFDELNLSVDGQTGLSVAGALAEEWDLVGTLRLPDLAVLGVPELAGALEGDFQVGGARERPDLQLELAGRDLRGPGGLVLGRLALSARIPALGEADSRIRLRLDDLAAGPEHLNEVVVEVTGREEDHRATLVAGGRGGLEVDLALAGAFDRASGDWQGTLAHARLMAPRYGHRLALEQPLPLAWGSDPGALRVDAHCWTVNEQGRLCVDEPAVVAASGELIFSLSDYNLQAGLRPWLPEDLSLRAALGAEGRVTWGEALVAELALVSEDGTLRIRLDDEDDEQDHEELRYESLTARLDYTETRTELAVDLSSAQLGDARLRLVTDPRPGARGLDGELVLEDLGVSVARAFVPQLNRLEGVLRAQADIGGDWTAPDIRGQITLEDGLADGPELPVALSDIQFTVDVAGAQADYAATFRAGAGRGELRGRVLWGGEAWQVFANLDGEALEVFLPPGLDLEVWPALRAVVRPNHILLRGRVDVPRGTIEIQDLPQQAVGLSPDVVVVERTEDMLVVDEEALVGWDLDVDVELRLGAESLTLTAFGLTGALEGNMRVRLRDDDVAEGVGEIRVVDGRYRTYGQNLRIRRGNLLFAGPVDQPQLEIEAVRDVPRYDVVAGIRVEGRADDPRASLFSEPAMPDDEALSYLIRGRPLSAEGDGAEAMMASAALGLGVRGASGIVGGLGQALGVEDLEVEAVGEGDEAQVVIGGYLNPRLYLSYGVGVFNPENTLTLRYQLARQLFLEAVSGVENALDLMYRFEFGGRGEPDREE
ncbi:translocation/assembly module TamB domain-containing protein [Alkalilimnicola ehrlichii]|uniref:autotransporter assembly complex protein TamB n=1 Tax=Alkalilimnicola ehrlichii TaxID=351052 RepID=UPI003BA194DA